MKKTILLIGIISLVIFSQFGNSLTPSKKVIIIGKQNKKMKNLEEYIDKEELKNHEILHVKNIADLARQLKQYQNDSIDTLIFYGEMDSGKFYFNDGYLVTFHFNKKSNYRPYLLKLKYKIKNKGKVTFLNSKIFLGTKGITFEKRLKLFFKKKQINISTKNAD